MLTATEYLMREPLPLHRVHEAIFDFCRAHSEVVVFGAQAVNIHVPEPRMSQDVDLLSDHPRATAEALAGALHEAFHIAARVREVKAGKGFRVFQLRADASRHFADVRLAEFALDDESVLMRDGIRYLSVGVLVAMKVCALAGRRQTPKGATDLADLRRLLLAHPDLRKAEARIPALVERVGGGPSSQAAWVELLVEPLTPEVDEGY